MAKRSAKKDEPPAGLQVQRKRCDALMLDPANVRRHPERNLEAIKGSLAMFGQQRPILIRENGVVLAGNGTLEAARALGWQEIDVVVTTLEGAKAMAYAIADNKTTDLSEFGFADLAEQLREIEAENHDLAMATGFADFELDPLLKAEWSPPGENGQPSVTEDEPPEPPAEPITKPGDLIIMGDHRLLCGDSTKAEDVALVMNGERAGLMNTDPPYGVAYDNADRTERNGQGVAFVRSKKAAVENDAIQGNDLQAFLESVFRLAVEAPLTKNAAWYLWHANLTEGFFSAAAAAVNVVLHRSIIWVKPHFLIGRGQYHWKHEPCFMGWVEGHQPPDYGLGNGERTQTTVWEIGSVTNAERKEFNHATPKPVALFAIPIVKHLKPGELCYEPFAGSGPQFIAAEQLGRRCAGLELEPRFCDVIATRG
jgi:DNA modification methylase